MEARELLRRRSLLSLFVSLTFSLTILIIARFSFLVKAACGTVELGVTLDQSAVGVRCVSLFSISENPGQVLWDLSAHIQFTLTQAVLSALSQIYCFHLSDSSLSLYPSLFLSIMVKYSLCMVLSGF